MELQSAYVSIGSETASSYAVSVLPFLSSSSPSIPCRYILIANGTAALSRRVVGGSHTCETLVIDDCDTRTCGSSQGMYVGRCVIQRRLVRDCLCTTSVGKRKAHEKDKINVRISLYWLIGEPLIDQVNTLSQYINLRARDAQPSRQHQRQRRTLGHHCIIGRVWGLGGFCGCS